MQQKGSQYIWSEGANQPPATLYRKWILYAARNFNLQRKPSSLAAWWWGQINIWAYTVCQPLWASLNPPHTHTHWWNPIGAAVSNVVAICLYTLWQSNQTLQHPTSSAYKQSSQRVKHQQTRKKERNTSPRLLVWAWAWVCILFVCAYIVYI